MAPRRLSRGVAPVELLAYIPLWSVMFGAFLYNAQVNRLSVGRDVLDHAAAVAADTATKVLCDSAPELAGTPLGRPDGARAAAVEERVLPLLDLVTDARRKCRIAYRDGDGGPVRRVQDASDPAVHIECEVPCPIPFAAQALCRGQSLALASSHPVRPAGCDMRMGGGL